MATEKLTRFFTWALPNETIFQFHKENLELFEKYNPVALGIEPFLPTYRKLFADFDATIEVIRKSEYTQMIADADYSRDRFIIGLRTYAKSSTHHYEPAIA